MPASTSSAPKSFTRDGIARAFRILPGFRGKTRLIRITNYLLNKILPEQLVISRLESGDLFILDMKSRTEFIAHYTGSYDREMIRALTSLFRPGFTVLDVGANIGFYSVPFGRALQTLGGTLLCFEPVPSNFRRLQENLALNELGATQVLPIALSDQPAILKMTLREDFEGGGGTGNAAVLIADQADNRFSTVDVAAQRLDDFVEEKRIPKIDFIKVDIEGHEDLFLAGARLSIDRFRPIVLSEFNEAYFARRKVDLDDWLASFTKQHRYVGLRPDSDGHWREIRTLVARRNTDDVLLAPEERTTEVLAALNAG